MSRRHLVVVAAVLVALPCATLVAVVPAQPGPIRIGFVTDLTGPAAQAGPAATPGPVSSTYLPNNAALDRGVPHRPRP